MNRGARAEPTPPECALAAEMFDHFCSAGTMKQILARSSQAHGRPRHCSRSSTRVLITRCTQRGAHAHRARCSS
ncbi:putative Protein MICAL-3, partial [Operophtera brumata]